jgi:hypothetical protein
LKVVGTSLMKARKADSLFVDWIHISKVGTSNVPRDTRVVISMDVNAEALKGDPLLLKGYLMELA